MRLARSRGGHVPCTPGKLPASPTPDHDREVPIRTLSVSLLAVAAIAASLLIVRQRDERPNLSLLTGGDERPAQQLDAIRAAGL